MSVDILKMSALEQAQAIGKGVLSSTEVTAAYLQQIHEQNELLWALLSLSPKRTMRAARAADRKKSDAVFAGVPTAIKDIDMVRGMLCRNGSRATRWLLAPVDGGAAKRVRRAGMVIVGKSTTSEFAILPATEPDIHPPTRNPWNPEHTCGGSSGGAASAVAAGMLPVAHASDGAGSIRIPAAFNNLVGLKTSRGTVPNFYAPMETLGISSSASVSRTVADSAAFVDVLRGTSHPQNDPESFLQQHKKDPGRLRIRLTLRNHLLPLPDPQILDAVLQTAKILEGLGHIVEHEERSFVGEIEDFVPFMSRSVANIPLSRKHMQPVTAWMHRAGKHVSATEAKNSFATFARRVDAWFGDTDLVLTPTVAVPTPKIGALDRDSGYLTFREAAKLGVYTAPCNISGQPAISVPCGLRDDGLPMGVQLIAARGEDLRLLQVARQLEEAQPWRQHYWWNRGGLR